MSRLYFVRHGESSWNALGRVQGQTPFPELTEKGREQARGAAETLRNLRTARLFTSDLSRASQTAEIIAAATGLTPLVSPLLREMDFGDWQGLSLEEAAVAWQSYFRDDGWEGDRRESYRRIPGGESLADLEARVAAFLASPLVSETDSGVIVVSHGDTIRVALGYLLGEGPEDMPWRAVGNGEVHLVSRQPGALPEYEVLPLPAAG